MTTALGAFAVRLGLAFGRFSEPPLPPFHSVISSVVEESLTIPFFNDQRCLDCARHDKERGRDREIARYRVSQHRGEHINAAGHASFR